VKKVAERRKLAIALGVGLLAVPTVFTVFSEFTRWIWPLRALVLVGWGTVAFFAVRAATDRDHKLDTITHRVEERRAKRMRVAVNEAFRALTTAHSFPKHYAFTVYMPDDLVKPAELIPIYPSWHEAGDDIRIFEIGKGATGTCWQRWDASKAVTATFVVTGDAVSDDTHQLTAKQQALFKKCRTVVATPILDEDDQLIGVLTAISEREDGAFDEGKPGQAALRELADVLGVLISNVMPTE
jgi:hypothetical protein